MKYIINGRIVMPDRVVDGYALAYDKVIAGIISPDAIGENDEVIDACGGYVCPGLVDLHIHGYLNADASDGDSEGIKRIAYNVAQNGVTSFLPTTMTVSIDELNKALDSVRAVREESRSWDGAEILGVHAEGPFINPSKKGAQAEENILAPDADYVLKNSDIIRIVTIAPEMDKDFCAIKKITSQSKVVVSMGHTDATYECAVEAVKSGVSHCTHLFNAMSSLQHRKPGVVGAALSTDVSTELICDTFHINPGLFELVASIKKDKLVLITDCTRAGGMPDGEYSLGGQKTIVSGIKCLLEDGTIAGSVLKLNTAVRNFRDNTSLDVSNIVNMASLNAARVIGEDNHIGSLEIGKDADIFVADSDFNVQCTIKCGRTIYSK